MKAGWFDFEKVTNAPDSNKNPLPEL